ncbi:extracellular solute-binding protein [Paenibacillus sp. 598K]|uniref:extracellular solute-binding protein n=1 Tax=Paenibacillus sp. 598K TaxID=1117987 RepID=UPI001627C37E|nr:extracellular solute-binding protein [Paenibacillus sp. 598K]
MKRTKDEQMNKKRRAPWLAVALVLAVTAAGCQDRNEPTTPGGSSNPSSLETDDKLQSKASTDTIRLEMMENGWSNIPTDEEDPWRQWMKEQYKIDMTMNAMPVGDLEARLLVRFASAEQPDLIFAWDRSLIAKLHKQGVLLDDWTPYLTRLPNVTRTWSDQMKAYATVDGKVIGLPKLPDEYTWTLMLRKDWLDALQLPVPTTDVELLDVLRSFTYDDPDNNGLDDTWGISSAGAGSDVGEIGVLESMYGPTGFHVGPDGMAQHSVVNGTHLKFLAFMRTLVQEQLIDPDWYTQSWEQRKRRLYEGKIGIVHYPGIIVQEGEKTNGATGSTVAWWDAMQIPKGSELGGKRPPAPIAGGMLAVSAQAAKDPEKMARILTFLDATVYPTEGYWALRWGVGVNGQTVTALEDGAKYISLKNDPYRKEKIGAHDWGTWVATSQDGVLEGQTDRPGLADQKQLALDGKAKSLASYTNYHELLHLDTQMTSDLKKLTQAFDIAYILGKTDDYDAFRQRWLEAGGQQLLDEASRQLTEMNRLP